MTAGGLAEWSALLKSRVVHLASPFGVPDGTLNTIDCDADPARDFAPERIAQAGGGRVESYPHDLTDQTKKMSSSFLYNGTRRLYERLGFTYDRPKGLKNCVMVKTVEPS